MLTPFPESPGEIKLHHPQYYWLDNTSPSSLPSPTSLPYPPTIFSGITSQVNFTDSNLFLRACVEGNKTKTNVCPSLPCPRLCVSTECSAHNSKSAHTWKRALEGKTPDSSTLLGGKSVGVTVSQHGEAWI